MIMTGPETAGSVLTSYLAEPCDRVIGLTEDGLADSGTVHATRIALRRLRSTLRTFAALIEEGPAAWLDREARWWAGLLGEVRDRDVLAGRLAGRADELADLTAEQVRPVLAGLASDRSRARDAAAAALGSDRYAELISTLRRWRADPPLTEAAAGPAESITDYVRRARRTERKRVRAAIESGSPDEELHRARKAAKRHRYAIEVEALAADVSGASSKKKWSKKKRRKRKQRAKRSRKLQRLLGRHQDAVVAARFLESAAATEAGSAEARRLLLRHERGLAADTRL